MKLLMATMCVLFFASAAYAQASPYARAIERAVSAYNAGDFAAARAGFAEAHALRPNARTWRGMGTSDFELARWPEAVEELTQALEDTRSPLTPDLRTRTEAQLETARTQLPPPVVELPAVAAVELVPAVVEEPVLAPPSRGFGVLRSLGVASLVVSAAGFALATGYGLRSMREGDTRDEYCDDRGACIDARGVEAGNDARRFGNLATAGWILGGAGLAGAVTLFWLHRARDTERRAQLRLGPTSIALAGTL
jgi:tetratricopeptide (TPR) repeat protein